MGHYNVNPRYTSGSPAMVDRTTAERVARQEKRSFDDIMAGRFGPDHLAKAKATGLKGIAEYVVERRKDRRDGWDVNDLITGECYWRPYVLRDGTPAAETCEDANDHSVDVGKIRFQAVDGNVVLVATCARCGERAQSDPILIVWPRKD